MYLTLLCRSDLADSEANRAAFISNLKDFMSKYGFQGVDIDWEVGLLEAWASQRSGTDSETNYSILPLLSEEGSAPIIRTMYLSSKR